MTDSVEHLCHGDGIFGGHQSMGRPEPEDVAVGSGHPAGILDQSSDIEADRIAQSQRGRRTGPGSISQFIGLVSHREVNVMEEGMERRERCSTYFAAPTLPPVHHICSWNLPWQFMQNMCYMISPSKAHIYAFYRWKTYINNQLEFVGRKSFQWQIYVHFHTSN